MNSRHKLIKSTNNYLNRILQKKVNTLGEGYDLYEPNKLFIYPEVYAKYIVSFIDLYELYGDKIYLDKAVSCASWLIKNKSEFYTEYQWGLPFEFNSVPKNGPYLITTSFCGIAFYKLYDLTKDPVYLKIFKSSINWIEQVLYDKKNKFVHYSPFKIHNFLIVNANSVCLEFLSLAEAYLSKSQILMKKHIYKTIINFQNFDGSWGYSSKHPYIDNVHSCYTLEGLWSDYFIKKNAFHLENILKGTSFLRDFFFNNPSGKIS